MLWHDTSSKTICDWIICLSMVVGKKSNWELELDFHNCFMVIDIFSAPSLLSTEIQRHRSSRLSSRSASFKPAKPPVDFPAPDLSKLKKEFKVRDSVRQKRHSNFFSISVFIKKPWQATHLMNTMLASFLVWLLVTECTGGAKVSRLQRRKQIGK